MKRLVMLALLATWPAVVAAAEEPLLVLLTETGEERDGLPVLALHPGADEVAAGLGLNGALLRVYRHVQGYLELKGGARPEPAYVLLSSRQGGFAREGFHLGDEDKSRAGYVDEERAPS